MDDVVPTATTITAPSITAGWGTLVGSITCKKTHTHTHTHTAEGEGRTGPSYDLIL